MRSDQNHQSAGVSFEGLEHRQFWSTTPAVHFAPPVFGGMAGMPPIVFDAAFAGSRGAVAFSPPMISTDISGTSGTAVPVATNAVQVAAPEAFNGYPSTATDALSASISMEWVNRAVDNDFVPTGSAGSATPNDVSRSDATSAAAAMRPLAVAAESASSTAPPAPALPDGPVAAPLSPFSSEPIRSTAAVDANFITTDLRSAGEQVACVVRLAWADIAYTNVGESIGRYATEAGQALSHHAGDAELAAAVVMGVAGTAWWVKQTEEIAEPSTKQEHSLVETVHPRPLAG